MKKELLEALAARYGKDNFRITDDGGVDVRRGSKKWRRLKNLSVTDQGLSGRRKELTGGRKVTIYMDTASEVQAKMLGNGNLSLGIRIALQVSGTVPLP